MDSAVLEVELATQSARAMRTTLEDAITVATELSTSMRTLRHEPLFAAATRRAELHATLTRMTEELETALTALAHKRGWQQVTLAQLATVAPQATAVLAGELEQIRRCAGDLKELDGRNRVKGLRTLGWLRSVLNGPGGGMPGYDRRGQVVGPPTLSTANRTL